MSIKLMTEVWELDLPHPQLLVALSMADHGHDDGSSIFPSLPRIAWKCGYSDRQVRRIVRELEVSGLLVKVAEPSGARGVEYRMVTAAGNPKRQFVPVKGGGQNVRPSGADKMSGGGGHFDQGGADIAVSAEPSKEPSVSTSANAEVRGERARDRGHDDPEVVRLCGLLASLIAARDPKATVTPGSDAWVRPMRLLLTQRSPAEVEFVIRWCQNDDFWQSNVLSAASLRKQFDRLWAKAQRSQPKSVGGSATDPLAGYTAEQRNRIARQARRASQFAGREITVREYLDTIRSQTNPQEEPHADHQRSLPSPARPHQPAQPAVGRAQAG